MSVSAPGIVAYRRPRGARTGLALAVMAGVVGLSGAAHAADVAVAADPADEGATVSGVIVTGEQKPLNRDTGLPVLTRTVQDTPQAISVVSSAQLKAQGVNTLEGALRNVPGITIAIGEGGTLSGDQFKIRGFDAKDDVYVDGLRDFGAYTRDSFNYEEVQVLKGPSGAMFGRGTTGGAIDTISKQPKLDDFTSVDLYAGAGRYYRALGDIDHRLGEHAAARLTLMANDTGVVDRDDIYSQRWGAALTLAVGLGTPTSATVSYLHQHDRQRPDYGVIIVQKPGDIVALPATEPNGGNGGQGPYSMNAWGLQNISTARLDFDLGQAWGSATTWTTPSGSRVPCASAPTCRRPCSSPIRTSTTAANWWSPMRTASTP